MANGTGLPVRLASPAPLRTFYVDTSIGSDANSVAQAQSEATPWLTVQKALSTATTAGDRIYVKNGTYSPPGGFGGSTSHRHEMGAAGTAAHPIELMAYPGHSPVIQSGSSAVGSDPTSALKILGTCAYFRVGPSTPGYVTASHLIFQRRAVNKGNSQVIDVSADAPAAAAHDIEIMGNELRNSYTASLFYAGDNCLRVDFYCNKCHHPDGYRDTETTLNGALTNVATAVTVVSGVGFANNDFVRIEADGTNAAEIVQITAGGGTVNLTVLRAQKGTVGVPHLTGAVLAKGAQHHAVYQTGDNGVVGCNFVHDMPQSFGLQTRTNQANPGQSPQTVYVVHNTVVDCRQDYGSGPGGGTGGLLEGRALNCVVTGNIFKGCGNRGLDGGVPSGPSAPTNATTNAQDGVTDPVSVTFAATPASYPSTNGFYLLIGSEILQVIAGAGTAAYTCSRAQLGSAIAAHISGSTATLHEASGNIGKKNIAHGNTTSQFSHSNANWRIINYHAGGGFTFGTGPGDNLTTDPLFVSYVPGIGTNPDCRLQVGSPAIGIGIDIYCPPFDFFGNIRGGADAGAFAYVAPADPLAGKEADTTALSMAIAT